MNRIIKAICIFMAGLTSLSVSAQHNAKNTFNNVNANGVILDGYDAVAFFTDNKPLKGDEKFRFGVSGAASAQQDEEIAIAGSKVKIE